MFFKNLKGTFQLANPLASIVVQHIFYFLPKLNPVLIQSPSIKSLNWCGDETNRKVPSKPLHTCYNHSNTSSSSGIGERSIVTSGDGSGVWGFTYLFIFHSTVSIQMKAMTLYSFGWSRSGKQSF